MRTGLIAKKLGMTRVFNDAGRHVPVTVLQLEGCQVVAQRTNEKDGYTALQLGAGTRKVKNVTKAQRGHFAKAEVAMIGVVDGMVCMACQAKVEKELKAATGESNVEVSWPEGVAFINFENTPNFSEVDFKKVIEDAGFAVGKVATLNEKIIDPKSGLISLNKF